MYKETVYNLNHLQWWKVAEIFSLSCSKLHCNYCTDSHVAFCTTYEWTSNICWHWSHSILFHLSLFMMCVWGKVLNFFVKIFVRGSWHLSIITRVNFHWDFLKHGIESFTGLMNLFKLNKQIFSSLKRWKISKD